MKVAILGSGAYGMALSIAFNKNVKDIVLWTPFEEEKKALEKTRANEKVLPGVKLPKDIKIDTNLKRVVNGSTLIVIAIPTEFIEGAVKQLAEFIEPHQHICIASKGIQNETGMFLHEVVLNYIKTKRIAVISGPTFAIDIAHSDPMGLTVAAKSKDTEKILSATLASDSLRLRRSRDIIGVQTCGAVKNVIAIGSGMIDGLGYSVGTQAMFVTESLHDIKALIAALGGRKSAILNYAGFGDLMMTATSVKSRNFRFGQLVGKGATKKEIEDYINNTTVEGIYTLKSVRKLLKKKQIKMPVIDLIYDIVYNEKDPHELGKFLIDKE